MLVCLEISMEQRDNLMQNKPEVDQTVYFRIEHAANQRLRI